MENDVTETARGRDFISQIVADEVAAGKNGGRVQTRFPPEPNGYLHIGHAKAICVDFGVAEEFGGTCYLRFDDTNPERETEEFVESIKRDVHWLGFDWGDRLRHASDYFQEIHDCAVELIKRGLAYVDHQNADDIRKNRGTLTEPGKNSPYRDRSVEENLRLFEAMKRGDVDEGVCVLRAKIDMASPNINLRDPTLYRIRKVAHQRTGSRVVHLPDVRLRAHAVGCDRRHDAFALHARVRGSPAALRLVPRPALAGAAEPAAADRVLAREPDVHRDEQAQAQAARRRQARRRLGRSAHADARRHPSPRLHAGIDRRVRAPHRHDEEGKGGRARPARGLRPRASERDARRAASPCSIR